MGKVCRPPSTTTFKPSHHWGVIMLELYCLCLSSFNLLSSFILQPSKYYIDQNCSMRTQKHIYCIRGSSDIKAGLKFLSELKVITIMYCSVTANMYWYSSHPIILALKSSYCYVPVHCHNFTYIYFFDLWYSFVQCPTKVSTALAFLYGLHAGPLLNFYLWNITCWNV